MVSKKQNKTNKTEKKGLNDEIIRRCSQMATQLSLAIGPFKSTLREQEGEDYLSDQNDYGLE